MRSLSSSFACRKAAPATGPADDTLTWAADCVAHPQRYGADARTREIVANLLAEAVAR